MLRRRRLAVIWPIYFNSRVSRSQGRKVPLELAVEDPKVDEIVEAVRMMGLTPIVEDKAYPKMWWKEKSRILVEKRMGKSKLLKEIARNIKKIRKKSVVE